MTDKCRIEIVDGEPIRVRGKELMNDKDREMLAVIVRAAKRKLVEQHPDESE